jgi:hypothetical protein
MTSKIMLSWRKYISILWQRTQLSKTNIFLVGSELQCNHMVCYTPSLLRRLSRDSYPILLNGNIPRGCAELQDHTDNPRLIETFYITKT